MEEKKTYKREVAVAMLVVLAALFFTSFFVDRALEIAQYLTSPIFLFNGAAFGMDSMSKQFKL